MWYAALLAATGAATAGALAGHPVRVDDNGGPAAVDQPTGWFNAVQGPLILVLLLLSLAFIARQALSWRRATGERRQQLKWLASGAAVSIICLFLAASSSSSSPGNGPTLWGVLSTLAWMGVAALPVSIGVAILKLGSTMSRLTFWLPSRLRPFAAQGSCSPARTRGPG